jgi:hypothetical protein
MPVKSSEYPVPIGLRVTQAQAQKIDTWAAQMGLPRTAMVRYLIEHARLVSVPRISIGEVMLPPAGPATVEEAIHAD